MSADLTARVADLAALIEARLAEDQTTAEAATKAAMSSWLAANSLLLVRDAEGVFSVDVAEVADYLYDAVLIHAARHDPARVFRRVRATRELVAAILAERHDYNAEDGYYSCSQAQEGAGLIGGPTGPPGSGCSDPERSGRPCDCGRDARAARLLGIIAGEWEVA